MGYFFTPADDYEIIIFQMANRRATLFVSLTQTAAQIYEVEGPVIELIEDRFRVHTTPFCLVVERAFELPINLLYVWASYAAGFYEALRGEQIRWFWGGGTVGLDFQNQAIPIEAQRFYDAPQAQRSDKVIGPRWYAVQQESLKDATPK